MPTRKTDKQILDEILAERAMGWQRDPVAEAKAFLGRKSVTDEPTESQATRDAMARVAPGAIEHYGPVIGETAMEAAPLLGSTLAGPLGVAAGGYMALQGANEFRKDPTLLGGVGTALGAIPALRAFGRMGGVAAKEAPVLLRGADEFADVAGRQPVSRAAGETFDMTGRGRVGFNRPTEFNPAEASFDRFMPNTPSTAPVPPSGAPARAAFNTQTPELVGDVGETVSAPGFDLGDIVDAPLSVAAEKAARRRQRTEQMLAELRAAQQHGVAGFRNLPQMGGSETDRISAAIDRIVGGR